MTYSFRIPGRPKSKSRPRFARGRAYTDKKTLDAEQRVADLYDGPFYEEPVSMTMVFHPDWTDVTIGPIDQAISPLTADASNLCKLVEDALNGVAYPDDRLIQMLLVKKIPR